MTKDRGYGVEHRTLRQYWLGRLEAGHVATCSRCGQPVAHYEEWDLDHTDDRKGYLGPAHASCNRSAGSQKGHRLYRIKKVKMRQRNASRNWVAPL